MLFRTWMLVLLAVTWTASADDKSGDGDEDLGVGLKMAFRLYDECERRGDTLAVCLKMRAVNLLDRAMRLPEIPLGESVLLVRSSEEDDATGGSRGASQDDLADRSSSPGQREDRVDRALMDRVARFISSHRLQLTLPRLQGEDLERGVEEGRGKMKKMMGMMMMGMASKMAGLIPAAIAGLFLLAGKALIVSKMALVLILVIALKKIVAQRQNEGGHHYEMAHGWQGGHGGGGHGGGGHGGADWDRRSLAAHRMAYRAQHRPRAADAAAAAAKEKAAA
ncbi:uncharacterized protein LOC124606363 [Schistocerca americana]|uniref:uncharacterized protein LOC124606363 n=1 Tax=Schistocerca americana TaxID=7009 RepID=UPI001F4F43A3|nr:uncharacterized protein LOC124606363 [Schistocerca americana]